MATLEEYLAMLQPDPAATRKAAMMEAIGALGAGLLSGRNWQQGISRGGLLAYDAMQGARDRASGDKLAQLKLHMSAQEMADKDAARESDAAFAKQIGGVFAPGPRLDAMQPGGPTPANATRVAPPGRVEKLRQAAELYAARGQVKEAQMLLAEAEKMEGTFSVDPKTGLGADGKPQFAQFSNKGGYRAAEGIAPPPDMTLVDTGGAKTFVDKLTTKPGTSFAMTMDPAQKDASARGWAGLGLEREKFGYQQGKDALDRQAASVTGGKPSDAQLMARGFLERMQASGGIISKLEDEGYAPGVGEGIAQGIGDLPVVGGALGPIARGIGSIATPQQPLYRQAQMDWVRAKLRKESGAVIGPKEMQDEITTYFPQPGDSKAVIKQKAESRRAAERAMSISAGLTNYTGKAGAPDPLGIRK